MQCLIAAAALVPSAAPLHANEPDWQEEDYPLEEGDLAIDLASAPPLDDDHRAQCAHRPDRPRSSAVQG